MPYEWDTIRTTTDKLGAELNDLEWDIHQIQYTGGRDWVIICRQAVPDPNTWKGTAQRNLDNTLWEITIPSMGPNDEPLTAHALQAEWIDAIAEEVIANYLNIPTSEVNVDINVDTRPPRPS